MIGRFSLVYILASLGMVAVVAVVLWLRFVTNAPATSAPVLVTFAAGLVCALTIQRTAPDDDQED